MNIIVKPKQVSPPKGDPPPPLRPIKKRKYV